MKARTCHAGFGCKRRLKKGERLFCSKCLTEALGRRASELPLDKLYPGIIAWGPDVRVDPVTGRTILVRS